MSSLVQKTERIDREHAVDTKVSAGGVGAQFRLPLKRDSLLAELIIHVSLSQVFAVAPTASDVRRAFKSISIESGDGERLVNVPFHVVYDLGRFTESASTAAVVLGTPSTANFAFEIHFEADAAKHDALSFFRTKDLSDLTLVMDMADDASGVFSGGTTPGAQTMTVVVAAEEYPDMLADPVWGSIRKVLRAETTANETSTGDKTVKLRGRNATRFIIIHAFDMSGAVPVLSDAFLNSVTIQIGERVKKKIRATAIRQDNISKRGVNLTGVYVIDQGDDETSWLDFTDAGEVDLILNVASATSHRFIIGQEFYVPMVPQSIGG